MSQRILFVCLGNICRSPAAEGVFRVRAPHHSCDSSGTSDWHVGDPPYAPMQHAARNRGLELRDLRARQFAVSDFDRFDLIIGMDSENLAKIKALRPTGNHTPVHLLTEFAPNTGADHVPDPYYTRDFDGALDLIGAAVDGLVAYLDG